MEPVTLPAEIIDETATRAATPGETLPHGAAQQPLLTLRPPRGWTALNLREIWQFRDLMFSLAGRDLKLRYKQTVLGVIWVILQPLMAAGVFSFVFGKLASFPSDGVPYFLFSYAGLLGWNLFNGTLTKASGCLVGNSQLISKVFFPRLVLPLSGILTTMIDFSVAIAMLGVMMVLYRVIPGWQLVLLPVWMAILLLISLGVGLVTAALAVSYRDVQYILPVATQILLYGSPIAYGLSTVMKKLTPETRFLYLLNPIAAPLEAFRWSLLNTTPPPINGLIYSAVMAVVIFIVGAYSFKRMERQFADVI
jgi:lipopolysaccharide transport system permease protein